MIEAEFVMMIAAALLGWLVLREFLSHRRAIAEMKFKQERLRAEEKQRDEVRSTGIVDR